MASQPLPPSAVIIVPPPPRLHRYLKVVHWVSETIVKLVWIICSLLICTREIMFKLFYFCFFLGGGGLFSEFKQKDGLLKRSVVASKGEVVMRKKNIHSPYFFSLVWGTQTGVKQEGKREEGKESRRERRGRRRETGRRLFPTTSEVKRFIIVRRKYLIYFTKNRERLFLASRFWEVLRRRPWGGLGRSRLTNDAAHSSPHALMGDRGGGGGLFESFHKKQQTFRLLLGCLIALIQTLPQI